MKLATYKDSSRDGQLVVVSRDLSMAPTQVKKPERSGFFVL